MTLPPGFFLGMAAELGRRAAHAAVAFAGRMRRPLAAVFLIALLITEFVILFSPAYATPPPSSAFNEDWNGASMLFALSSRSHPTKAAYVSLGELAPLGSDATLVLIAPTENYSFAERSIIRAFVSNGGTLIISDAHGPAAELAREFNIRLANATIADFASFNRRQDLPLIPFSVGGRQGVLYAKFPTSLLNYPLDAAVLAATSAQSFLDFNGNHAIDQGDLSGPFPVAIASAFGNGTVVVLSDASALSNDLLARGDNAVFADAILSRYARGVVVFDESHRGGARGGVLASLTAFWEKSTDAGAVLAATLAIALGTGAWLFLEARRPRQRGARERQPHSFRDLVEDIRANARVRSEPYAWIVLMQHDRLRDRLAAAVNPFGEKLSDRALAERAAKKTNGDAEDLLGLLERLESIKKGLTSVESMEEALALCRVIDENVRRLSKER